MSVVLASGASGFFKTLPSEGEDDDSHKVVPIGVTIVICLLAFVEGMDIILIGVTQQAWYTDIANWTLATAGWLSMAQGIVQNAGAVFWGIAADRGYMKRKDILVVAAILQAACTLSLTAVSTIGPMWPIRAFNGFFLAALRPISNGIVADLAPKATQGYYFGLMQGLWSLGMGATGMIVGPIAERTFDLPIIGPAQGWRLAMVVVSSFAIVASVLCAKLMPDVPAAPLSDEERSQSPGQVALSEIKSMFSFFRLPSFVLMICQGIFGSIPWIVMGNLNTYARLCGFALNDLIWLQAAGLFGMLGGFLGGYVSDRLVQVKAIGLKGRPLTAMLTVAFGVPLQYTLWWGIEPGSALNTLWVFVLIQCLFNTLATWAQPGCNFPVLSQIVTGKNRNKVLCWEMAFENSCAMALGSNAVPFFFFVFNLPEFTYDKENPVNLEMARNLGMGQTLVICVPWIICFFVYSGLLRTFERDVRTLTAEREAQLVEMN